MERIKLMTRLNWCLKDRKDPRLRRWVSKGLRQRMNLGQTAMPGTQWVLYEHLWYEQIWTCLNQVKRPSRLSCPHLKSSHCTWSFAMHSIRTPALAQGVPIPRISLTLVNLDKAGQEKRPKPSCPLTNGFWLHLKATFEIPSSLKSKPKILVFPQDNSQKEKDQH